MKEMSRHYKEIRKILFNAVCFYVYPVGLGKKFNNNPYVLVQY